MLMFIQKFTYLSVTPSFSFFILYFEFSFSLFIPIFIFLYDRSNIATYFSTFVPSIFYSLGSNFQIFFKSPSTHPLFKFCYIFILFLTEELISFLTQTRKWSLLNCIFFRDKRILNCVLTWSWLSVLFVLPPSFIAIYKCHLFSIIENLEILS